MIDDILWFLQCAYDDWRKEGIADAYGDQKLKSEYVTNRNDLFKELIDKRKQQVLKETRDIVLNKLTKQEIEILGLK